MLDCIRYWFVAVLVSVFVFTPFHSLAQVATGQYIVKVRPTLNLRTKLRLAEPLSDFKPTRELRGETFLFRSAAVESRSRQSLVPYDPDTVAIECQAIADELLAQGIQIEYCEADEVIEADRLPNEIGNPWWPSFYGLNHIRAEEAWNFSTGSSDVVIAVLDSGIDLHHPDLRDNLWVNKKEIPGDGIDNDRNGFIDDVNGWDFVGDDNDPQEAESRYEGDEVLIHGTHVAGIIAAQGGNFRYRSGVVWDAQVMPLRLLGRNGVGLLSDAVLAIRYATAHGAKIINGSWGKAFYTNALQDAIAAAGDAGVLYVASAGNKGRDIDRSIPHYPANLELDNIITVAATGKNGRLVWWSNYGEHSVDIAAPGEQIVSLLPGEQIGFMSGTSMAAPFVSGAAAYLLSLKPNLSVQELKSRLLDGEQQLMDHSFGGAGKRLDLIRASEGIRSSDNGSLDRGNARISGKFRLILRRTLSKRVKRRLLRRIIRKGASVLLVSEKIALEKQVGARFQFANLAPGKYLLSYVLRSKRICPVSDIPITVPAGGKLRLRLPIVLKSGGLRGGC